MEPVRWGRDDKISFGSFVAPAIAAMEPVRWGRDDTDVRLSRSARLIRPQWSPSAGDGTTRRAGRPARRGAGRRNGARPLGTGRPSAAAALLFSEPPPQWSPSAGDGTTFADDMRPTDAVAAAMEPVRWGRDDCRCP